MKPTMPGTEGERYDCLVKVVIVGESGVGKTNILTRFVDDQFRHNHLSTIGVDYKIKTLNVEEMKLKLLIWDTAGQERFRNIPQSYYKGAAGVIMVYSICDRASFNNLEFWINQLSSSSGEVSTVIVGNKSDAPSREVTFAEGSKLADRVRAKFLEVSAKDNINITQIFTTLSLMMKHNFINSQYEASTKNSYLKAPEKAPSRCLC